ncbi:hypothetical protein GcC1_204040, partial [Golovinomyces cichoracearum]
MEATQANVAAARGARARRGRCGGRGYQKKAQPKRNPITKDNILNKYPDSSIYISASLQPYYQTPQHEYSSLHLRDQSVPVRSIEWPQTPIRRSSANRLRGPPTSHSTEEQDNDIVKNRRGLKYNWVDEREFAMLRALVEWWPDYEAHYGSSSVKRHTSGWEKKSSGREFSYPGIDTGVLVYSLDTMRDHYNAYPKYRRFRKHRVNHVKLLEQLLGDKMADGRNSMKIRNLAREGAPKRKRLAKVD